MEQTCQSCLKKDTCSYVLMNGTYICSEYISLEEKNENFREVSKSVYPFTWGD